MEASRLVANIVASAQLSNSNHWYNEDLLKLRRSRYINVNVIAARHMPTMLIHACKGQCVMAGHDHQLE
jgi:hypothetical protein